MPKIVDHEERRAQIASALLRVAGRDGLEGVSLRHVAAEAGVTAGMVQHYFPSKDAMMDFAMRTASARYEQRIAGALASLGDEPPPREIASVLLHALIPASADEDQDARVGLAFQSYATTRPDAAAMLAEGNAQLREYLADLTAQTGSSDPALAATALLGTAEGLALHVLSADLPREDARRALEHQLAVTLDGAASAS